MFTIAIQAGDLIDPATCDGVFIRTEIVDDCVGVPCQHPGMPDAPRHAHLVVFQLK